MWSSLAEKYERRLDEDDIVDLESQTVIKDYGILRSTTDMYNIGCFAEQQEREHQGDDIGLDDEPDEIDAFGDNVDCASQRDTDAEDELELLHSQRLPPVQELDPEDAADLAEFLEAEKTRRSRFGDPDDDVDDENLRLVEIRDEVGTSSESEQLSSHYGSEGDSIYEQDRRRTRN